MGTEAKLEYLSLMHGVATGLAHTHAHDIAHLDLKTENILLGQPARTCSSQTPSGTRWIPKLADFGLASRIDAASGRVNLPDGDLFRCV